MTQEQQRDRFERLMRAMAKGLSDKEFAARVKARSGDGYEDFAIDWAWTGYQLASQPCENAATEAVNPFAEAIRTAMYRLETLFQNTLSDHVPAVDLSTCTTMEAYANGNDRAGQSCYQMAMLAYKTLEVALAATSGDTDKQVVCTFEVNGDEIIYKDRATSGGGE